MSCAACGCWGTEERALRDTGNYVTGAAWHYKRDDQADTCCDPNPGMSGHNRD